MLSLFLLILFGVIGLAVLIVSAEFIVRQLIGLAHNYGVSESFVGLTVLSVGTSLPEIGSHVIASLGILSGKLDYEIASGMVLGANIGSDVVQQTLIVGLVVLLGGTLVFEKSFLRKSYGMMIGTTLLTLILGWDGKISRFDGIILLLVFFGYMFYLYKGEKKVHTHRHKKELRWSPTITILLVIVGLGFLLASSALVLKITEIIVASTNLGGSLIGVISLGIASALPEMLTALSGLRNKSVGVSVGTLIGSNITNPLLAIGLGGLISTYFVPKPLVYWDLPMETITAALLLVWLIFRGRKLDKWGAFYLIGMYAVYLLVRIFFFSVD